MSAPTIYLQGLGLAGPGLAGWLGSQPVLAGRDGYVSSPTTISPAQRLPPAERRRAGIAIKLAMAVAEEACTQAAMEPSTLESIFASSSGDGTNCHELCEALASSAPLISPTRFTNSVHNAAAGYWHVAVRGHAASTSLCNFDGSFGAGLVEAVVQLQTRRRPLLLVASDSPYPEPLHATRPLSDSFGAALVLTPDARAGSLARLSVHLHASAPGAPGTHCADPALEALRLNTPAARALPLLELLAQERSGAVLIDYQDGLQLYVQVDLP